MRILFLKFNFLDSCRFLKLSFKAAPFIEKTTAPGENTLLQFTVIIFLGNATICRGKNAMFLGKIHGFSCFEAPAADRLSQSSQLATASAKPREPKPGAQGFYLCFWSDLPEVLSVSGGDFL